MTAGQKEMVRRLRANALSLHALWQVRGWQCDLDEAELLEAAAAEIETLAKETAIV